MTHYETLGVAKDADAAEIKRAWRALALIHHPDRGGAVDSFNAVKDAWSVLSDPAQRTAYDLSLLMLCSCGNPKIPGADACVVCALMRRPRSTADSDKPPRQRQKAASPPPPTANPGGARDDAPHGAGPGARGAPSRETARVGRPPSDGERKRKVREDAAAIRGAWAPPPSVDGFSVDGDFVVSGPDDLLAGILADTSFRGAPLDVKLRMDRDGAIRLSGTTVRDARRIHDRLRGASGLFNLVRSIVGG